MCFSGGKPNADKWKDISLHEWQRALPWLDHGGLALYFLSSMQETRCLNLLPHDVLQQLRQREAANRQRTTDALVELAELTSRLDSAGVRHAILKGFALVPDYCPDPARRTQYDHDILIEDASLPSADLVFRELGYVQKPVKEKQCVVYRPPQTEVRFAGSAQARYSPKLGRALEVHVMLWESAEEKIHIDLPDDFLDRSIPRSWNGLKFPALCDEDCLLFQVLHAFRHILRNWCRLSLFLELSHFLKSRATEDSFWSRYAARIGNIHCARDASYVVLGLAARLFGAPLRPDVERAMKTALSPPLTLWMDLYGVKAAMNQFSRDKSSLFLHREFVPDRQDWRLIRRRRLFPSNPPHRPPAIVFQRGFSQVARRWMETRHALRRLHFHGAALLRYATAYPRWMFLRRLRAAESR